MQQQWMTVKVAAKHHEATDICSYELVAMDGQPLPTFTAGAHIDVQIRGRITRQYSLCNPPGEQHRYVIAVLNDPNSRGGSVAMHERVAAGDLLEISAPRNHFPLDETARKTVLFAGGIGVTPMLAMAERLTQLGADFEFHYCARSADRMAFVDRIRHSAYASQTHLHLDDGDASQKLALSAVLGQPEAGKHLYVCGPNGFMSWILDTAKQVGWPEAQVHREYFAAAPSSAPKGEFEIELSSSGRVLQVAAEQSIAQVLQANGIDVPVSCEQGVCGTCLTRVLAGEPEHRDSYLTDAERAANDQILVCCSRAKSPKLVLDL